MKTTISTINTPFTLDTYATFDMSWDEHLIDDGKTYDDYDFDYDFDGYLVALSDSLITFLNENITDSIIKSVAREGKIYSPKFYNYTTDSCNLVIDFDARKLNKYIKDNFDDFKKFNDSKSYYISWDNYDDKIIYYIEKNFSHLSDVYIMHQFETVHDTDYITCTEK